VKNKVEQYFNKFSNKDLLGLEKMFHPNVQLIDWDNNVSGRDKVLEANKQIFDKVDSVKVTILQNACEDQTVFSELLINIIVNGQSTFLNVVDVITFKDGKIYSIHAFKR